MSLQLIIAFILGAAVAVLFAWLWSLSRRVSALERRQVPESYQPTSQGLRRVL